MILVRSALFNIWFFSLTAILSIYGVGLRMVAPGRVMGLVSLWARLVLGGLRLICGIRLRVSGREYLPRGGAALIASRHQSAFDTLVWLTLLPHCAYVLKQELLRIPFFGALIRPAGQIAVDRRGGARALRELVRQSAEAAQAGRQIVIFPEGTRAPPGRILPLQPGVAAIVARTGLPVIPVVTDSGAYWGRRAFRKRPGTVHITLLEPLPASLGREVLMHRLAKALASDPEALVDKSVH